MLKILEKKKVWIKCIVVFWRKPTCNKTSNAELYAAIENLIMLINSILNNFNKLHNCKFEMWRDVIVIEVIIALLKFIFNHTIPSFQFKFNSVKFVTSTKINN